MEIDNNINSNLIGNQTLNLSRHQLGSANIQSIFDRYDADGDGKLNSSNKDGFNEIAKFIQDYTKIIADGIQNAESNIFKAIYNKINEFMTSDNSDKVYLDGEETTANGVLEDNMQGRIGDCWLLSQLNSLKGTDFGKQAIKEAIAKNSDGSYTVTLKGTNETYTFTAEDIQAAIDTNQYSTGDLDYLLLELAFEKHYNMAYDELTEDQKEYLGGLKEAWDATDGLSIEGGSGPRNGDTPKGSFYDKDISFLLGIEAYSIVFDSDIVENPMTSNEILRIKGENREQVAVVFGSSYDIEQKSEFQAGSHEYSVENVTFNNDDIESVQIINPWDNTHTIDINVEEFSKYANARVHIITTDEGTGDKAKHLQTSASMNNYLENFNNQDSEWTDLFIPDELDKKEVIEQCGGMKNYIDRYMEAALQDDVGVELSDSDLKTVTKNVYMDTFGFSEEDAIDLMENPEKLEYYCNKYGYRA